MNDEKLDELLRDAAQTYRKPPVADFDAIWAGVEARLGSEATSLASAPSVAPGATRPPIQPAAAVPSLSEGADTRSRGLVVPRWSQSGQWLALAATLVIGVALGRASMTVGPGANAHGTAMVASVVPASAGAYDEETSRYLGQTAALLISLPSEVRAGRADERFTGRAADLLSRTRLLIDSPAASDPEMRDLLEDLELVLAQVVRLQNDTTSRTELDLISRAIEQRDVMPRLRTAVADISAN